MARLTACGYPGNPSQQTLSHNTHCEVRLPTCPLQCVWWLPEETQENIDSTMHLPQTPKAIWGEKRVTNTFFSFIEYFFPGILESFLSNNLVCMRGKMERVHFHY